MGVTSKFEKNAFTVEFSEECVYDQKDMAEIRALIQTDIELPAGLNRLSEHLAKKYKTQKANIRQFIEDGIPGMLGPVFKEMQRTVIPQSPEFYHFLTTNPMIETFQGLLFESKKNTIDSVFVRNYLATLSEDELRKHEPLVWATMDKKKLSSITPVSSIQYSITFQKEGENVVIKIQDEGVGQDILDAFKEQHDFKRHKDKFPGRDNIYGAEQEMSAFGLRTGGAGKGARTEVAVLQTLGAKAPVFSANKEAPNGLGITIKYSHPLKENILENKEPKETEAITIHTQGPKPSTTSTIRMIEEPDEESDEDMNEITMLDVESLNPKSPNTDRMDTSLSASEANSEELNLSDLSDLSEISDNETPSPKSAKSEKPTPVVKPGGEFKKPMLTVFAPLAPSEDKPETPKPVVKSGGLKKQMLKLQLEDNPESPKPKSSKSPKR